MGEVLPVRDLEGFVAIARHVKRAAARIAIVGRFDGWISIGAGRREKMQIYSGSTSGDAVRFIRIERAVDRFVAHAVFGELAGVQR